MKLFINGKSVIVDARKSLGKGMEADVYRFGNLAVKIFKTPSHPDLLTDLDRASAKIKIEEHQTKLRQFPKTLPPRVVVPIDLVQDQSGNIAGYRFEREDPAPSGVGMKASLSKKIIQKKEFPEKLLYNKVVL